MAKKKKTVEEREEEFLAEILEATGGRTLTEVGQVPWYHDLGNFAVNYICSGKFIGGGLPGGKIIEVFGAEASGKSLLGYCFLGNIQRNGGIAIHVDCERASNADFAKAAGHVNPDVLITYEPEHWEEVTEKIFSVVKKIREVDKDRPIGIMLDSIGIVQTKREWQYSQLPIKHTQKQVDDIGKERPGERARAAGDFIRRAMGFLDNNKATLYVINQLRSNISTMKYAPKDVTSGGGRALPFCASTRIMLKAQKEMKEKDTNIPLGTRLKFQNRKSRCFTPKLETEGIRLYFDGGIDPLTGLLTVLIGAHRIKGKGTYTVQEPWAGGEKITFKGSKDKERNEISLDLLLKCPALIDAKDAQEVEDYISVWKNAMDKSSSGLVEEVEIDEETAKLQKAIGSDYWEED